MDAVCEVPYGSYPGNMPGLYFSDEKHLSKWLEVEKDERSLKAFLDKYIYGVDNFADYFKLCGGRDRVQQLRDIELGGSQG